MAPFGHTSILFVSTFVHTFWPNFVTALVPMSHIFGHGSLAAGGRGGGRGKKGKEEVEVKKEEGKRCKRKKGKGGGEGGGKREEKEEYKKCVTGKSRSQSLTCTALATSLFQ